MNFIHIEKNVMSEELELVFDHYTMLGTELKSHNFYALDKSKTSSDVQEKCRVLIEKFRKAYGVRVIMNDRVKTARCISASFFKPIVMLPLPDKLSGSNEQEKLAIWHHIALHELSHAVFAKHDESFAGKYSMLSFLTLTFSSLLMIVFGRYSKEYPLVFILLAIVTFINLMWLQCLKYKRNSIREKSIKEMSTEMCAQACEIYLKWSSEVKQESMWYVGIWTSCNPEKDRNEYLTKAKYMAKVQFDNSLPYLQKLAELKG